MRGRLPSVLLGVLVVWVLGGCSIDDLNLEGRECPCVDGWVCNESENRCVQMDGGAPGDSAAGDTTPSSDTMPPTDSSTGDSGMPVDSGVDAPPVDTGVPPDPTGCDDVHAGALFCDGFEGGDFSLWDRVRSPGMATATIVTDVVFRGASAMRSNAVPGVTGGAGPEVEVYPVDGAIGEQWLRAYYYVPSDSGLGIEINEMREVSGAYDFVNLINPTATNIHNHAAEWRDTSSNAFPLDTWVCVETHVRLNDAMTGVAEAYWDGVRVLQAADIDTSTPRGLSMVFAGISYKDRDDARYVYVDEVVADDSMIGCD